MRRAAYMAFVRTSLLESDNPARIVGTASRAGTSSEYKHLKMRARAAAEAVGSVFVSAGTSVDSGIPKPPMVLAAFQPTSLFLPTRHFMSAGRRETQLVCTAGR